MYTSIAQVDDGYELRLSQSPEVLPPSSPQERSLTFSLTRIELEVLHAHIGTVLLSNLEIYPSR